MLRKINTSDTLFFSTPFSALYTIGAVLGVPFIISPNQHPFIAQALVQAGSVFSFGDIDFNGLILPVQGGGETIASDYGGILPDIDSRIALWSNGAGYLDASSAAEISVIDLQSLNPLSAAPGALVQTADTVLAEEMRRFASLEVKQGHLWNDRIDRPGIDGLMSPLVRGYWEEQWETFAEKLKTVEEVTEYYRERFSSLQSVDLLPSRIPRVYPIKLAPELFCPKESIYTELLERGIEVRVPFKPLYRYDAFAGGKLSGCENFYKAVLSLPTHRIHRSEAHRIAETFREVIERHSYRSCMF